MEEREWGEVEDESTGFCRGGVEWAGQSGLGRGRAKGSGWVR